MKSEYYCEELDVTFTADVTMEDQGIGPYEFWGAKSTHHDWQPVVNDICWDVSKYSDTQNEMIEAYVDNNFEAIQDELIKRAPEPEQDYPEDYQYD